MPFRVHWRINHSWNALPYAGCIFLLGLVFLWPLTLHPTWIPMTGMDQMTDFLVTHLPYSNYIHDMWVENGQPPLWNSSMLSGMPLVSDPLSGYFYPPNWLTILFPTPAAYNLLFMLHLAWTGAGLFVFLRTRKLSQIAALFAAAAWMGTPKLIGYLGGGQVSTVFALAWLPWLLLAVDKLAHSMRLREAVFSAGVLAVITLADVRWGFYAGLLALVFLGSQVPFRKTNLRTVGGVLLVLLGFVVLLTAVLALPMAELTVRSERVSMVVGERAILAEEPANLIGVLAPQFGIIYELITYVGFPVLVLAVLGLKKIHWFWILLIIISVLYSLGQNSIFFSLISQLFPGFSLLRVPSRAWFFVALAVAVLAAYGIDYLILNGKNLNTVRWFRPLSFAFSLFAISLAVCLAVLYPPLPKGVLAFSVIAPATMLLLNGILTKPRRSWRYGLLLLLVVDLLWVNASIFRSIPLETAPAVVRWLEAQAGLFRVYSPDYSLPLPHSLQTAEGVNPTHLQDYSEFMSETSAIRTAGYSVSVPGIYLDEHSDPGLYVLAASPDLERLGMLNVRYIVASFPMDNMGQAVETFDGAYLYNNPAYRERAWLAGDGVVSITSWTPDRMSVRAETSTGGMVVFSEMDYPGWRAAVDGRPAAVERVDNLLRGVRIPAGEHEVVLSYLPMPFYIGLCVSLVGWAAFFYMTRAYVAALVARARSALS